MTEYIIRRPNGDPVTTTDGDTITWDKSEAERKAQRYNNRFNGGYTVEEYAENSAEDNDDSNDTMDDYTFIRNDDEESEDSSQQTLNDDWDWNLGDHTTASDDETNALSEAIGKTMDDLDDDLDDDLMGVLQDAQNLVASTNVSRYECPHEDCGLGHSHPDWKHDIRASPNTSKIRSNIPGFNIEMDFAEQMEFVPYCHCGANEAAMLVKFFPYFSVPMFKDQHLFEGVLELEPDVLEAIYRQYNEEGASVSRAVANVAVQRGQPEPEVAPLGVREDLERFLERRQQMEQQAQKAPIAQETRAVIEENRERLEEQTSQ